MSDMPFARLAFREEGKWWNCYLAKMDTMAGATRVGSIRIGVARGSPETKSAFMEAMKIALAAVIQETGGPAPSHWDERTAPEHEKAGNA